MLTKVVLLSLLVAICLSISCTPTKTMDTWMGHSASELIQSWGPPSRTTSDGSGGEILIYESTASWQTPGQVNTTFIGNSAYTTYMAPQVNSYQRSRMFYVNESGVIYHWRWQGM